MAIPTPDRGGSTRPKKKKKNSVYDVPGVRAMTPEDELALMFAMNPFSAVAGGISGYSIAPQVQLKPKNQSPYHTDSDDEFRRKGQKVAPRKTFKPHPASPGRIVNDAAGPRNTVDQLLNELVGSLQSEGVTFDYESALKESQQAIRRAYAQDIKAVRMGKRQARRETASGRRQLERLYGALGQSYEDMGEKQFRQGKQVANILDRSANRSANNIENNAEALLSENAALAEGLGIEAAVPEANQPILEEAVGTASRVRETGNNAFSRNIRAAQNNRKFMNRQAVNAELEGTNRQADLVGDLQDYLQQSNQDIAKIRGARGREIAANRLQFEQQAAESQAAADEEMWNRLMDVAGFQLDVENSRAKQAYNNATLQQRIAEASQAGQEEGLPVPDWYNDYNTILASAGRKRAPRLKNFMDQILGGDEFSGGRFEAPNGDILKLTPTQAANIVMQQAREAGMPESDVQILRLAALAYMEGQ